ncbi:MAG TPA: DUF4260 domain-containing protein [Sandaracinaceae bacterium]
MSTTTLETSTAPAPAVFGASRAILRTEAAIVFVASIALYRYFGGGWGALGALFFAPDLSSLGYLVGPRFGALLYNAAHAYVGPALLAGAAFALGAPALLLGALIWSAHVGFDRMLGYGLKYGRFTDTHLGRIGPTAARHERLRRGERAGAEPGCVLAP